MSASIDDRWRDRNGKPTKRDGIGKRWMARYRPHTNAPEVTKSFEKKVDATAWLTEQTAAIVTGLWADPKAGKITFSAFAELWSARQIWAESTVESNATAIESVTFSDVPLGQLRKSHLEGWVKSMHTRGLAPSTITVRFSVVRSVLKGAVADKRISTDPSNDVKLPKKRKAEAAMTIPKPEQVAAILADLAEHDPGFYAFASTAAFAGLRLGEIAGLQVEDIDFLRRTIRVNRQVQGSSRGTTKVVAPKHGSERPVPVSEELVQILAEHIRVQGLTEDPTHPGEVFVFGTDDGWVHNRNSVGHLWRRMRARVGLEDFTIHDLRHFYASALIADGCDVVTVQEALGHSLPSITLNTYSHLWPSAEDKTRAAGSRLAQSVLADQARTKASG